MNNSLPRVIAIITARMEPSRFPGKLQAVNCSLLDAIAIKFYYNYIIDASTGYSDKTLMMPFFIKRTIAIIAETAPDRGSRNEGLPKVAAYVIRILPLLILCLLYTRRKFLRLDGRKDYHPPINYHVKYRIFKATGQQP